MASRAVVAVLCLVPLVLGETPARAEDAPTVAPAPPKARVENEAWAVSLVPAGKLVAGAASAVSLVIEARAGFHVNTDYPLSFRPAKPTAVTWTTERLALAASLQREPCAKEPGTTCRGRATVPFVAVAKGPVEVSGTAAFSVCDAERCLIEKVPLAITLVVEERAANLAR